MKKSNFKKFIISNSTLPKDNRALPTEFQMTQEQADKKNKELAKQNAPGRFIPATKKNKVRN